MSSCFNSAEAPETPSGKLSAAALWNSSQSCSSHDHHHEDNCCSAQGPSLPRRGILKAFGAAMALTGVASLVHANSQEKKASSPKDNHHDDHDSEAASLKREEYFKKNYRLMTDDEKKKTIERLERLSQLEYGVDAQISTAAPIEGVKYGYAFNLSRCKGYGECISACQKENNQDRDSNMQYIKVFEMKNGNMSLESANGKYFHEVPAQGNFYMGVQCFHCEKSPCTKVCPVGATWKEPDGIVVVDYDWCIGCRYCMAACPYFGRRFNWSTPHVPQEEINPKQHYLGNRLRKKGVMEKCTFCIQRTREGRLPACAEACPTGARVFGNLLDPNSEIRWILANKKVFRLKEDLGTEPKFWYFMD